MKGIFFSQLRMNDSSFGTVKKVADEIVSFEKNGISMRHVNIDIEDKGLRKTRIQKGIMASIPFTYIFSPYRYNDSFDGYDFYYFRFEAADRYFTNFLKKLRARNPKAKIVIEFCDFPYIQSWKGPIFAGIRLKDYFARKTYPIAVNRFAVWNPDIKEAYGVPTIHYKNGIDIDRIPIRVPKRGNNGEIHALCVCTMYPFHGQDRLIKGMATYYSNDPTELFVLHLIGDGPGTELNYYKKLVTDNKLDRFVVFEGKKIGDELDDYFNLCDLAIGSLGLYRLGIEIGGSLKSREYLARGIPMVTGGPIDVLEGEDFKYSLELPNDDSEIDVKKIIDFWHKIYDYESSEAVVKNIRKFAEKKCDFSYTMGEVIDYVKNE